MSWRSGARLFIDMWPLIQRHVPQEDIRSDFVRDLIDFFQGWDMDGTDLRGIHPEVDKALDDLDVGQE